MTPRLPPAGRWDNRRRKPSLFKKVKTAVFIPGQKDYDLIVHVSNNSYARGGIWYPLYIGTIEQIRDLYRNWVYTYALMTGCLLIMAVYYFFHAVFMRKECTVFTCCFCLWFLLSAHWF